MINNLRRPVYLKLGSPARRESNFWASLKTGSCRPTEWAEMSIVSDTRHYEAWLRENCDVVNADLIRKHKRMRKNAFVFLRATYYRWARKIEIWCPELMDAPDVLSVGDTHTENFGTWRDREGRLVWGVNDFDETAVMP